MTGCVIDQPVVLIPRQIAPSCRYPRGQGDGSGTCKGYWGQQIGEAHYDADRLKWTHYYRIFEAGLVSSRGSTISIQNLKLDVVNMEHMRVRSPVHKVPDLGCVKSDHCCGYHIHHVGHTGDGQAIDREILVVKAQDHISS